MMKILKMLGLVSLLSVLNMPAHASYYKMKKQFRHHQDQQSLLIKEGILKGELTPKEVEELRDHQNYMKRLNQFFWRNGRLDRFERKTLKRELKVAHQRIKTLRQNNEVRRYVDHHGEQNYFSYRFGHYDFH